MSGYEDPRYQSKFNRDAAFSFNLDAKGVGGEIRELISIAGILYCFTEKSISTLTTAHTIDPQYEDPTTRHGTQAVYEVVPRNGARGLLMN